jgi:2-keto-3-deoxy-L-rhamnonate aldolase RhmA
MGILGDFRNPAFLDAARGVARACRDRDVIFGIAGIRDQELLTEFVGLGLRFVSAGTDIGFMAEAAGAQVRRLREIPVGKEGDA